MEGQYECEECRQRLTVLARLVREHGELQYIGERQRAALVALVRAAREVLALRWRGPRQARPGEWPRIEGSLRRAIEAAEALELFGPTGLEGGQW